VDSDHLPLEIEIEIITGRRRKKSRIGTRKNRREEGNRSHLG